MQLNGKNIEVIVQAGGRGSRLRHFTWNKPKCLVSYNGKPVIYHLFDYLNKANFHIIADYQVNKIKKYFMISPPRINYKIYSTNESGTCSGIKDVIKNIDKNKKIILIWSDLIIDKLPNINKAPTVVTTSSFMCRWSVQKNKIKETPSQTKGIPGIFYFKNKKTLEKIPSSGEFVKWCSKNLKKFNSLQVNNLKELGDFTTLESSYNKIGYGRYFNKILIKKDKVIKKSLDKNFSHLIKNEQNWYKEISKLNFLNVPKIYSIKPYTMEKINGDHFFEMKNLNTKKYFRIIGNILDALDRLHNKKEIQSNKIDIRKVYIEKTLQRLKTVSKIIPNYSSAETLTINGVKCKNYLHKKNRKIFEDLEKILFNNKFNPIHGDPTCSNILIQKNLKPIFFDPRGYFSNEASIFGDKFYDIAKFYYSMIGNYDFFNRRKFKLYADNQSVEIMMDNFYPNGAENIFKERFKSDFQKIQIIHALIWLSLSGYVKDDIDSILGSFYNGLYWLNKAIK